MGKLKPVVFVQGLRNFYGENRYTQNILLKAMMGGVTDPKELKKIAGLKTVADVYRTLDKIAIRREYHEALSRNGISLDLIVQGIKGIALSSGSDKTRLAAFQTFIKSLSLDKYDSDGDSGKDWEEKLMEYHDSKDLVEGDIVPDKKYIVDVPKIPESAKEKIEEDEKIGKNIYE